MADHCEVCPALIAEIAMLNRRISDITNQRDELRGGIHSTIALIRRETTDKPTMPRQQLIPAITERLNALLGR